MGLWNSITFPNRDFLNKILQINRNATNPQIAVLRVWKWHDTKPENVLQNEACAKRTGTVCINPHHFSRLEHESLKARCSGTVCVIYDYVYSTHMIGNQC